MFRGYTSCWLRLVGGNRVRPTALDWGWADGPAQIHGRLCAQDSGETPCPESVSIGPSAAIAPRPGFSPRGRGPTQSFGAGCPSLSAPRPATTAAVQGSAESASKVLASPAAPSRLGQLSDTPATATARRSGRTAGSVGNAMGASTPSALVAAAVTLRIRPPTRPPAGPRATSQRRARDPPAARAALRCKFAARTAVHICLWDACHTSRTGPAGWGARGLTARARTASQSQTSQHRSLPALRRGAPGRLADAEGTGDLASDASRSLATPQALPAVCRDDQPARTLSQPGRSATRWAVC